MALHSLQEKTNEEKESMQTTAAPLKQGASPANRALQKEHFKRNEQSLDYILRSGAAGGIAGCLVCRMIKRRKNSSILTL